MIKDPVAEAVAQAWDTVIERAGAHPARDPEPDTELIPAVEMIPAAEAEPTGDAEIIQDARPER